MWIVNRKKKVWRTKLVISSKYTYRSPINAGKIVTDSPLLELYSSLQQSKIYRSKGNYTIAIVRELLGRVGKDKHLLTKSDLNSGDKMRFEPTLKIMNAMVRTLLDQHQHAT
ncbi:uncharacterized protein LOC131432169 [Malaya genurostris]|uniref:uncharacterized protein LOC131429410 n=1 Tax=Malaya genurostris TaxID=325434 RepID=UPI0026F3E894|nr:uncharacterized protein LOC131429410 [Malaya genurostris]XP_058454265.1 uncharacterized protein LOC131432169 [Malaya genurostris]